jgi:hypothetical protein
MYQPLIETQGVAQVFHFLRCPGTARILAFSPWQPEGYGHE